MSDSRDQAVARMMNDHNIEESVAQRELKRRLKSAKAIIALDAYHAWALERGALLGGSPLNTVNYERVHRIVVSKPYHGATPLALSVWQVLDLLNIKLFNEYRRASGVTLTLVEVLMLTPAEYSTMRQARTALIKKRKSHG